MKNRLDEVDEDGIKLPKLAKLTYKQVIVLVMVALFVLGFSAGNNVGYRAGYSYVMDWYEIYIDRLCICTNTTSSMKFITSNEAFLSTLEVK